jgi:hypothetical protein
LIHGNDKESVVNALLAFIDQDPRLGRARGLENQPIGA